MGKVKTKGRRVTILFGALALLVVLALLSQGVRLVRSYRLWRLDHADAWEVAAPLLEALAIDAGRSGDPKLFVDRLGSAHQRYTFWFFAALQYEPSRIALRPDNGEPFQALQVRLKDDSELMTMWIQFLRWRHDRLFHKMINDDREAALARVEYAQIKQMLNEDEKRHARARWMVKNLEEIDYVGKIDAPTLPFPGWSGPVFELPKIDLPLFMIPD